MTLQEAAKTGQLPDFTPQDYHWQTAPKDSLPDCKSTYWPPRTAALFARVAANSEPGFHCGQF